MYSAAIAIAAAASASIALAQDPADGWMAYAVAELPEGAIINSASMKWTNLDNPTKGGAFYSPWFGEDNTIFLYATVSFAHSLASLCAHHVLWLKIQFVERFLGWYFLVWIWFKFFEVPHRHILPIPFYFHRRS